MRAPAPISASTAEAKESVNVAMPHRVGGKVLRKPNRSKEDAQRGYRSPDQRSGMARRLPVGIPRGTTATMSRSGPRTDRRPSAVPVRSAAEATPSLRDDPVVDGEVLLDHAVDTEATLVQR